jgi:3-dehydroquinate synthase
MSHIFLYGPPGTGKSTTGKILAHNLNLPFVDLDSVIQSDAGMQISHIMEQQGESAFRDMETIALKDLAAEKEGVIALGGGALLREENRLLAETRGTVVLLMAEPTTLLDRLKNDGGKRPLLAGNVQEKLISLLEQRKGHSSSFTIQMPIDGKTPEQIALEIQKRLGRFHLRSMGEYDVVVGHIDQVGNLLVERGLQNPVVVTDQNVAKFHAESVMASLERAGFSPKIIIIPAGEANKNLETLQKMWHTFLQHGLDRKSTVITLGGGVIGDIAGFAASTYMRGIPWVCVPTSLLSMVDASLGGKTGFDLPEGKNLIGSFYPPRLVLADPQMLRTLPEPEFMSGLAEVVKHGIIANPELFNLCARGLDCVKDNLNQVVSQAMAVKIKVIEEDPYERGFRAALNLGHTVGHAIELVSKFQLRHGEAVAIGMVAEARLAEHLAIASRGLSDKIQAVLSALRLPVEIPEDLPREEIIAAMRVDKKKNASTIRFALPAEIGKIELVDVADLESVFE